MKKILIYTITAILLGIITMLAPFGLFVGKMNEADWYSESTETMGERATTETLSEPTKQKLATMTQATHPLNMTFITFMLIFSLIVALSITLYLKRRVFGSSLP